MHTKLALEAELKGDYIRALNIYEDATQRTSESKERERYEHGIIFLTICALFSLLPSSLTHTYQRMMKLLSQTNKKWIYGKMVGWNALHV